ncbi:MAG: tetratricopeptide repeat protein [Candidatus Eisenbacteria bacterium]|nr:tetratricopeptide repeat protein [Candidatus Eisenbacteria bacterium]
MSRSRRVAWLGTLLLVLFPLIFFGLLEGALRLLDLYDPADEADPFIGLLESHRVFLADEARGVYFIDRYRAQSFNVQRFSMRKPPGTVRIFCLGGSAAYGYPFGAQVAFARWLQAGCKTLWPHLRFEVINAAGMSYGSYRVRGLLSEILDYDPDLVLVYSGHNEFIEKEFYIQSAATRLVGVRAFLSEFHLYHLLKSVVLGIGRPGGVRDAGYDEFGLHVERRENVGWTSEERATVLAKYAENIAAIAARLDRADVPLILMVPAPNFGDWRPEHSVLSDATPEGQVAAWSAAYGEGVRQQAAGEWRAAMDAYERARGIDDRHAELHYRLGQCREALEEYDAARRSYVAALDRDDVPIRISSAQRRSLWDVAERGEELFADAWRGLVDVAPHRILGSELFWDYCHPNVAGHQRVAALACSVLARSGVLDAPSLPEEIRLETPVSRWDLAALGMAPPDSVDLREMPRGADGLWWLGNCAQRQGDLAAAGAWYRKSLEANPHHPGSLIGLAIERSRAGEYDRAIELGRRALAIYQRMGVARMVVRAHSELGVFYSRAERYADAEREFREVLRRNPMHLGIYENLAKVLVLQGKLKEAERIARQGIARMPRQAGLHRQLGRIYQEQGRADEAIAAFEQELRLAPSDLFSHEALGDLLLGAGRPQEAAAHWEAVLQAAPGHEAVALKLAELYEAQGDREAARAVLQRFRQHGTPSAEARAVFERLAVPVE